ncbi:MAG TPA: hypothetical protein VGM03_03585 [Phycisphaerae bacterium]|jgi:hypothetical protein
MNKAIVRKVQVALGVLASVSAVRGIGCVSGQQLNDFERAETARVIANFLAVPGQLALQDLNTQLTEGAGTPNQVEMVPSAGRQ